MHTFGHKLLLFYFTVQLQKAMVNMYLCVLFLHDRICYCENRARIDHYMPSTTTISLYSVQVTHHIQSRDAVLSRGYDVLSRGYDVT